MSPSNTLFCERHGVDVSEVDYFCVHCHYFKKGRCVYVDKYKRPKLLREILDGMG